MREIIDKGASPLTTSKRSRPMQTFEQLYTIRDACGLLRVSRGTIYAWMKTRVIPWTVKTPGGTRIPASALNAFVNQRRVG